MTYKIGDLLLKTVKQGRRFYVEYSFLDYPTKDRWVAFVRRAAPKDKVGRYFTTERAAIAAIRMFAEKERGRAHE